MEFFTELSLWHWLILGVLLIVLETFGFGGFLLGTAVAAFVTGMLTWLGTSWQVQFISFGVMSLLFSVAYWKYFRKFNTYQDTDIPINDKLENMKGQVGKVISLTSEHAGKIKVGDTLWSFSSTDTCSEDDLVTVVDYSEMVLVVKKQ